MAVCASCSYPSGTSGLGANVPCESPILSSSSIKYFSSHLVSRSSAQHQAATKEATVFHMKQNACKHLDRSERHGPVDYPQDHPLVFETDGVSIVRVVALPTSHGTRMTLCQDNLTEFWSRNHRTRLDRAIVLLGGIIQVVSRYQNGDWVQVEATSQPSCHSRRHRPTRALDPCESYIAFAGGKRPGSFRLRSLGMSPHARTCDRKVNKNLNLEAKRPAPPEMVVHMVLLASPLVPIPLKERTANSGIYIQERCRPIAGRNENSSPCAPGKRSDISLPQAKVLPTGSLKTIYQRAAVFIEPSLRDNGMHSIGSLRFRLSPNSTSPTSSDSWLSSDILDRRFGHRLLDVSHWFHNKLHAGPVPQSALRVLP